MLLHRRVTPSIKFAGTHLYTWVDRGTVRVKCLAQELNTMSRARARTRTARSGDERTNHEASAPPNWKSYLQINSKRTDHVCESFIGSIGSVNLKVTTVAWTTCILKHSTLLLTNGLYQQLNYSVHLVTSLAFIGTYDNLERSVTLQHILFLY